MDNFWRCGNSANRLRGWRIVSGYHDLFFLGHRQFGAFFIHSHDRRGLNLGFFLDDYSENRSVDNLRDLNGLGSCSSGPEWPTR